MRVRLGGPHGKIDFPMWATTPCQSPYFLRAVPLTNRLETKGGGVQENLSCSSEYYQKLKSDKYYSWTKEFSRSKSTSHQCGTDHFFLSGDNSHLYRRVFWSLMSSGQWFKKLICVKRVFVTAVRHLWWVYTTTLTDKVNPQARDTYSPPLMRDGSNSNPSKLT